MRLPALLVGGLSFALIHAAAAADAASSSASPVAVAPNDAHIAYMGRVDLSEHAARMGYPGITIRFVYRGPAPAIKLTADTPNCFFNLACNGWDPVVIHPKAGENTIALPTGNAPEQGWLIELVRRTESWMGTASFDGLSLPPGCELLPPPPWPTRKLMFIGDSLTCGEYNERFPPEDDSTPRSTNAARSYGMLLARWLGAQVHLISYGGRGITRDWAGNADVNTVPVFFPRTLPDSASPPWDHTRYQPDVIAINIGTDFDAGPLDEKSYIEAYARFVAQVRSAHPQAFLLLCESGFQSDGSDGRPRAARDQLWRTLTAVAERCRAAGDTRVRPVRTAYHPGTATDPHLVAFQHEQVALDLLGAIREVAGW